MYSLILSLKSGFEIFSKKEKYDSFMKFYCSKGGSSRNNSIKNCSRPLPIFSVLDTTSNQVYYKIRIDESLSITTLYL